MRKRRYLAPWHRKVLDEDALHVQGEAAVGALAALRGKPAIYHCVSRVVNREFVFKREEKEHFVRLMRRYEAFSLVRVLTYCVMSNHFHILLEVPAAPEDGGASWSDDRLLEHLGLIYSGKQMAELRWELAHHREQGNAAAAEAFRARFFARMWDLSEYMKVLKQCFTQWFNRRYGRCGVLWEERFRSELVEDGHAARRVAGYIDLNPVRARIVEDPKDYRWSGYGEAVAGKTTARAGLRLVLFENLLRGSGCEQAARQVATWENVLRRYRMVLFEDGRERATDQGRRRAGIAPRQAEEVLAARGLLSESDLLWCRTRYFVDGLVIGSEAFVNHVFVLTRGYFGPRRRIGAYRLKRVASSLFTMRNMRKGVVGASGGVC